MSDDAHTHLRVEASVLTDRGCVRPSNEDCAVYVRPADDALRAARGTLAVVADGMGGHRSGQVASAIACEVVRRVYYRAEGTATEALAEAFVMANRVIHQRAAADPELRGMGTTCTALVIHQGHGHLAHVGDSRLYLLRGGEMVQLTEDHSYVAELVRRRALTAEQARRNQYRNVVTRAMGTAPSTEVATWPQPLPLRVDDRFLLATDGLHECVAPERIAELAGTADVHAAGAALLEAAKKGGGADNISLVLLAVHDAAREPAEDVGATRKFDVSELVEQMGTIGKPP